MFLIVLSALKQDSARCLSGDDAVKTSKVQAGEGVPEPPHGPRSYGCEGDSFSSLLLCLFL